MSRRRPLVVALAAVAVLAGTATSAGAAPDDIVARWEMDEPPGSRTMTDSSGHGLHGRIGKEVGTGTRYGGATGYRFPRLQPDTPPARPEHVATVPDRSALDPGGRDYAVTVRLRTTNHFGNIVQKGQATVAGGNWKLQIPNGIVQCMFRGSKGTLLVSAKRRINDGSWHTVRCERTRKQVALTIDGSVSARRSGGVGTISNSWPVAIGGKTSCDQKKVGCDYFAGDIDYVQIEAG